MSASRWLKIGLAAATVVALYVLAAMGLGPTLAERRLHGFLAEPGGLEVSVARVRVDPFTLVAEYQDLVLSRPGEPPLLAAERVFTGFALASLWRRGMNLTSLELLRPRISLDRWPAELTGLSDWVAQRASEGQPLVIRQIRIEDGSVRVAPAGSGPHALELDRLTLSGTGLGSAPEAPGEIRLVARHSLGGSLRIETHAGLSPVSARGSFDLGLSDLGAVARWLEMDIEPPRGSVTVRGAFGVAAPTGQPRLTLAGLSLHGEEMEFRTAGALLRLDAARLEAVDLDFPGHGVRAAGIAIDGGALKIGAESLLHAVRWLRDSGWTLSADRIETRGLALDFDGESRWPLRDVELELLGFDSGAATRGDFTMAATLGGAPLTARGWLTPETPALEATVALSGFDLTTLEPRLRLTRSLDLDAGDASAEGTLSLAPDRSRAAGTVELKDFSVIDRTEQGPALSAASARFDGIVVDAASSRPRIERLRLSNVEVDFELDDGGRPHPSWSELASDLPLTIDRIEIDGGGLTLTDARLAPPLEIRLTGLSGAADGLQADAMSLRMEAGFNQTGTATLRANWRPGGAHREALIDVDLAGVEQPVLSAYAARFAGREIDSGELNVGLRYLLRGDRYRGRQRLVLDGLRLGRRVGREPTAALDLAAALLMDPSRRVEVTVPAEGAIIGPNFNLVSAVGESLSDFLSVLREAPFRTLSELVGLPDEDLGGIAFEPGSAAVTAVSERRLSALRDALAQRPGLALRVAGGYAPAADRAALARQQLRLHVALATAAGPSAATDPAPPAFADAKIQSVLDEFAGERLAESQRAAIASHHAAGPSASYYRALFEALIASEPIGEPALKKLARYRAQAIAGALRELGAPAERLRVAEAVAVSEDGGEDWVRVPLKLEIVDAALEPDRG